MRLLAVGDIHGCLRALAALLDAVAPRPDDRLITLGDYVDRGPDSRGVLDRLIELHDAGRLVALRGNHDMMMLDARHTADPMWLACGGVATLVSYGVPEEEIDAAVDADGDCAALLAAVPPRHWRFLEEECRPWYETEEYLFVHANLYPDLPLPDQPDYMLYWEKLVEPCRHVSGKVMVCGHTRQKSGLPLDLGSTVCIDTNVYDGGWLTCLDVQGGRVWQANEEGQTRTFRLESEPEA